jgi:hypothetical protein
MSSYDAHVVVHSECGILYSYGATVVSIGCKLQDRRICDTVLPAPRCMLMLEALLGGCVA